jgi:hypothetical protein
MANLTVSRNYFYPQPIEDFATLQAARRASAGLKSLSWCFEMIGRAGLFVTSYQVLEYGFKAFHLRSTLMSLAASIAGLALSRLCQRLAVAQLAGLTKEKELSIHFEYYKQYLENQPSVEAGIKGYLAVGDALSLEEQQELLDLAYPKGIIVIFTQYEAKLNYQEWRERGFVELEKRYPYIYKQIYNSYGCIIDFIEQRLTNTKKVENPDKKNLDLEFINKQLEFLGFKWTGTTANAKAAVVNLIPLFSVKSSTTVALGASACLLGAEIIPYLKFFASRGFNIEMDCSYLTRPIDETYLTQFKLTRKQAAKQTNIHTIAYEEIDPISQCFLNLKNELVSVRKLIVSQSTKGKTAPPSVEEQERNLKHLKIYLRHCYPSIRWNFIENKSISQEDKKGSRLTEIKDDEKARLRERRQNFFDKLSSNRQRK